MRPIVRVIGKVLHLVGISSPENSAPKPITASDPPSWRIPAAIPSNPEKSSTE
jgi:hypothetical protein